MTCSLRVDCCCAGGAAARGALLAAAGSRVPAALAGHWPVVEPSSSKGQACKSHDPRNAPRCQWGLAPQALPRLSAQPLAGARAAWRPQGPARGLPGRPWPSKLLQAAGGRTGRKLRQKAVLRARERRVGKSRLKEEEYWAVTAALASVLDRPSPALIDPSLPLLSVLSTFPINDLILEQRDRACGGSERALAILLETIQPNLELGRVGSPCRRLLLDMSGVAACWVQQSVAAPRLAPPGSRRPAFPG